MNAFFMNLFPQVGNRPLPHYIFFLALLAASAGVSHGDHVALFESRVTTMMSSSLRLPTSMGSSWEALTLLHIGRRLPVLVETRPDRDEQHVRILLDDDLGAGAHTRAEPGVQSFGQSGARRKALLGRRSTLEDQGGDGADKVQRGAEFLIRNGVDANSHCLANLQLSTVYFFQLEIDIQLGEFRNLYDLRAVPNVVALFEGRRLPFAAEGTLCDRKLESTLRPRHPWERASCIMPR